MMLTEELSDGAGRAMNECGCNRPLHVVHFITSVVVVVPLGRMVSNARGICKLYLTKPGLKLFQRNTEWEVGID